MNKKTELQLVEMLRNERVPAFDELFRRYHFQVYRFALRLLHSDQEAEEIVQESFLAVWQNRHKIDPNQNFQSYLFAIVRNHVHSAIRSKMNYFRYLEKLQLNEEDSEDVLEYEAEWQEIQAFFHSELEKMPERRREIFCLSRFDRLTYREIAARLSISENTVDTQIRNALDTLRQGYQKKIKKK